MTTEQRKVEKRKSNFETRLNTNILCCDDVPGNIFTIDKNNPMVEYSQSCLVCGATIQKADHPIRDFGICDECKETILMSRCLVDKLREGKFDKLLG